MKPVPAAALLLALVVAPSLSAQTGEAPILHVEGRPMLRATLRAGDASYMCHLLLDLSRTEALFLHRNVVSVLKSESCDLTIGGIELEDMRFSSRRDTWLEKLTADFATELNEVPVAGILGLAAFGESTVVIDGPGKKLTIRAPGTTADDQGEHRTALVLPADPRRNPVQIPVLVERTRAARLILHSREPFGFIDEDFARSIGHPDGILRSLVPVLENGTSTLNFARYQPLRPGRINAAIQGGIGARTLEQLEVTIEMRAGRVVFHHPDTPDYAQDEADFYAARFSEAPLPALKALVGEKRGGGHRHEAAITLLKLALESEPRDVATAEMAALAAVDAAKPEKKGGEALSLLESMPLDSAFMPIRESLIRTAIPLSRNDVDGTAVHQLRVELGRIERRRGNLDEARRHLLAAAFGDASNGTANLELGRLHEAAGELERARGRYFLAMLDARRTGELGLQAFIDVQKKMGGGWMEELEELGDGRIPALHPIPREPEEIKPTGRVALVELFTGAQCPPCAGADVAVDALSTHYGTDEIAVIQWHLPVPAPEPMVAEASLARAQRKGVRGTPSTFFGGNVPVGGGGEAKDAPVLFGRYQEALTPLLKAQPDLTITGTVERVGPDILELKASVAPARGRLHAILVQTKIAYPGRNGIVFHHNVARAAFTPNQGAVATAEPQVFRLSLPEVEAALDSTIGRYEQEQIFVVRPTDLDQDRLAVILFVEDSNGQVLQAATWPVKGNRG